MLSDATSSLVYYYPGPEELHLVYIYIPLPIIGHLAHGDDIAPPIEVESASSVCILFVCSHHVACVLHDPSPCPNIV